MRVTLSVNCYTGPLTVLLQDSEVGLKVNAQQRRLGRQDTCLHLLTSFIFDHPEKQKCVT